MKLKGKGKIGIYKELLRRIWNDNFNDKPFPENVIVVEQTFKEFMKTFNSFSKEAKSQANINSFIEHNKPLNLQTVEAYTFFFAEKNRPLIILRKNRVLPLEETLKHELEHIYSGDIYR